jgi:hypothetical protein
VGPPKGESGDCMGDGSLQTQFGVNLHPKGVKNGVDGEADRVSLTGTVCQRQVEFQTSGVGWYSYYFGLPCPALPHHPH